eukprot:gb/GECG01009533.1/.p1 GENE.gb/GECG01009533.1/~~gb/GECG01009533.1/.p1  ORF type:complete len:217 (+),score=22.66 gb/GECG01009533.1/:1-651(+)
MVVHPKRRRVSDIISPPSTAWRTKEELDGNGGRNMSHSAHSVTSNKSEQLQKSSPSTLHDITNCKYLSGNRSGETTETKASRMRRQCALNNAQQDRTTRTANKERLVRVDTRNKARPITKMSSKSKQLLRWRQRGVVRQPGQCDAASKLLLIIFAFLGALFLDGYVQSRANIEQEVKELQPRSSQDAIAQYAGLELAALGPNERNEVLILPALVSS